MPGAHTRKWNRKRKQKGRVSVNKGVAWTHQEIIHHCALAHSSLVPAPALPGLSPRTEFLPFPASVKKENPTPQLKCWSRGVLLLRSLQSSSVQGDQEILAGMAFDADTNTHV